jgi:hypothetical protein
MFANFELGIMRNGILVDSIIPQIVHDKGLLRVSSSSSMSEFPVAHLSSKEKTINQKLMLFSKGDLLTIRARKDPNDEFKLIFKGIFHTKKFSFDKKVNEEHLEIIAIHSFYILSRMQLSSIKNYSNISFDNFLFEIVKLAGININDIYTLDDIKDIKINMLAYNANLFRLFKVICFQNNLSVDFNIDNTVKIEYREDKLKRILGQKPVVTLTDNDILSGENIQTGP